MEKDRERCVFYIDIEVIKYLHYILICMRQVLVRAYILFMHVPLEVHLQYISISRYRRYCTVYIHSTSCVVGQKSAREVFFHRAKPHLFAGCAR
jgi:hypothetical protein